MKEKSRILLCVVLAGAVLFLAGETFSQIPRDTLRVFTVADTAKCKTLYVNSQKYVEVKWNLKQPYGKRFVIYNAAGRISSKGRLIKGLNVTRFDFSAKMPGTYFLFVSDERERILLRRKIIYIQQNFKATVRPRR